jgi:hypothetical protein
MDRYFSLIIKRAVIFLMIVFTMLCAFFVVSAQPNKNSAAVKPTQDMNGFINELMSKMTIEEKIGQLNLVSVGFDVTGPINKKRTGRRCVQHFHTHCSKKTPATRG